MSKSNLDKLLDRVEQRVKVQAEALQRIAGLPSSFQSKFPAIADEAIARAEEIAGGSAGFKIVEDPTLKPDEYYISHVMGDDDD